MVPAGTVKFFRTSSDNCFDTDAGFALGFKSTYTEKLLDNQSLSASCLKKLPFEKVDSDMIQLKYRLELRGTFLNTPVILSGVSRKLNVNDFPRRSLFLLKSLMARSSLIIIVFGSFNALSLLPSTKEKSKISRKELL